MTGKAPAGHPSAEVIFEKFGRDSYLYDERTGEFFHRIPDHNPFKTEHALRTWITKYAGKKAGKLNDQGYAYLHLHYRWMRAHRFVWFLKTGKWPVGIVDHINGDRSDNRFENLRLVDQSANMMNRRRGTDNKTGVIGVSLRGNSYVASICVRGKSRYLGSYSTLEAARDARLAAQAKSDFGPTHGADPVMASEWRP